MNLNYKISPEGGILFVDHQKNRRSGHLSHALVEYKKGCILSFYSNCSPTRNGGHSGFGWLEYKRSQDGGICWDEAKRLEYSWDSFLNETFTVSCEKAVSTRENEIVAFCTRSTNPDGWEPYLAPTAIISEDGGESWSAPIPLWDKRGRIYDAIVVDGVIYVLFHAAPDWLASESEHQYFIYQSEDHGRSFSLRGTLPGDPTGHAYGSMALRDDGALICYTYNKNDEYNLDYCISHDMGRTFTESGSCYCAKRIRNPQVAKVKGGYLLHGRSGCETDELPWYFVLYSSKDGIHWDEGEYILEKMGRSSYYSNNLVLEDGEKQRVLIQSSVPYDGGRVNIGQWFVDIL